MTKLTLISTLIFTSLLSTKLWSVCVPHGSTTAAKTDLEISRCQLLDRLNHSDSKDRSHRFFSTIYNSGLDYINIKSAGSAILITKYLRLDTNPDSNIFSKEVKKAIGNFIAARINTGEEYKGSSPEDIKEMLNIRNEIIEMTKDGRIKPDQAALLSIGADVMLQNGIVKISEDLYELKVEVYEQFSAQAVTNHEFQNALGQFEDKIKKLENKITKDLGKATELATNRANKIKEMAVEVARSEKRLKELQKKKKPSNEEQKEKELLESKIAKENEAIRKEYNQNKILISEISNATTIVTSLLSIVDPVRAQRVGTIVQSSLKIAEAINAISAGAKLGTAASLGPYAVMAVAVLQIFKALQKKGPSPEQLILDQIQKLSQQVAELRKEMHDRFNVIEDMLGQVYKEMLVNFSALSKDMAELKRMAISSRKALGKVRQSLGSLNGKLNEVAIELYSQGFNETMNECLKAPITFADQVDGLERADYNKCIQKVLHWTEVGSKNPILTGLKIDVNNDDILLDELRSSHHNSVINTISKLADARGWTEYQHLVANPIAWAVGVENYTVLRTNNLKYSDITDVDGIRLSGIQNRGLEITDFVTDLQSNEAIFEDIFAHYSDARAEAQKLFREGVSEYIEATYVNGVNKDLRKLLEGLDKDNEIMLSGPIEHNVHGENLSTAMRFDINYIQGIIRYNEMSLSGSIGAIHTLDAFVNLSREGYQPYGDTDVIPVEICDKNDPYVTDRTLFFNSRSQNLKMNTELQKLKLAERMGLGKLNLCFKNDPTRVNAPGFGTSHRNVSKFKFEIIGTFLNKETGEKEEVFHTVYKAPDMSVNRASCLPTWLKSNMHNVEAPRVTSVANTIRTSWHGMRSWFGAGENIYGAMIICNLQEELSKENLNQETMDKSLEALDTKLITAFEVFKMNALASGLKKMESVKTKISLYSELAKEFSYYISNFSFLNDFKYRSALEGSQGIIDFESYQDHLADKLKNGSLIRKANNQFDKDKAALEKSKQLLIERQKQKEPFLLVEDALKLIDEVYSSLHPDLETY